MIKKEQNWVEKYRPQYFAEIKGQEIAVQKVKQFVENFAFRKGETMTVQKLLKARGANPKRSLILHGPPGTGKTTLAHVAAKESGSEIFELNASDLRNKTKLQEILKPALEQKSLLKENKLILVDEIDGISKVDYGGLSELLILVETSVYPVIITANDIWNKKFGSLRRKSEVIQLKEIDYRTIKDVLINILRKENLFLVNEILTKISMKAKGDLRAAINDLQAASKMKDPLDLVLDDRNKEIDIFNALRLIFKGKPTNETLRIFDSVKMPIDEIILWVEENIPTEYSGVELARAYDLLSKVDVFKGRIYKQQYWRFLVYENILLSYGISASKTSTKTGFTNYKKPDRILKIWINNQRIAKKKSIATKYAKHVHVGAKRALHEFPILKPILKSNKAIQKELKLTEEEIDYIENGECTKT
ncbi:MAG: replication factor C large subunit [archaeon]